MSVAMVNDFHLFEYLSFLPLFSQDEKAVFHAIRTEILKYCGFIASKKYHSYLGRL